MSVWHGVGSEPNLQHKHKQILNEDTHTKKEEKKTRDISPSLGLHTLPEWYST